MNQEIKFQIRNIELVDFSLNHPLQPLIQETKYKFNINIEQKFIEQQNLVAIMTTVNMIHEEDQQVHGSIKTNCLYLIDNLAQYINEEIKSVELPDQFNTTLISISLSTTRGIMFSQFKGTFLHNTILPIVNPTEFRKENSSQRT